MKMTWKKSRRCNLKIDRSILCQRDADGKGVRVRGLS
jgi:hypothetical protein